MSDFTRCKHDKTKGEADLATAALDHWAALGWSPVDAPKPAAKRGSKTAGESGESTATEKE